MQRGASGAQRVGVGAVGVGERVTVADCLGEKRGAVPAERDRRALIPSRRLGVAAAHGSDT